MATNPLSKHRHKALKKLLYAPPYNGNITAFAKDIGRARAYISQLINGHKPIGEQMARYIEATLNLRPLSLDGRPHVFTSFDSDSEDLELVKAVFARQRHTWRYAPSDQEPLVEYRAVPLVPWEKLSMGINPKTKKRAIRFNKNERWKRRICPVRCSEDTFITPMNDIRFEPVVNQDEEVAVDGDRTAPEDAKLLLVHHPSFGKDIFRWQLCKSTGQGDFTLSDAYNPEVGDRIIMRLTPEHDILGTTIYVGREPVFYHSPTTRRPASDREQLPDDNDNDNDNDNGKSYLS